MNQTQIQSIAFGVLLIISIGILIAWKLGWFVEGKLDLIDGEGVIRNESALKSIASNAKKALAGTNINTDYLKSVCEQITKLNNNELRYLHNYYLVNHADEYAPTIKLLIQGELVGSFFSGGICSQSSQNDPYSICYYQKRAVEKLNSINA